MVAPRSPSDEELDAFSALSHEEIARLVLCLLVEERLRERLAAFRSENLSTQPVDGSEKLCFRGDDVMAIRNSTG